MADEMVTCGLCGRLHPPLRLPEIDDWVGRRVKELNLCQVCVLREAAKAAHFARAVLELQLELQGKG